MKGTATLIDTEELARVLKLSRASIQRACREGRFPFFKTSERGYRFELQEVLEALHHEAGEEKTD